MSVAGPLVSSLSGPIAFVNIGQIVTVTATASPGTLIGSVNVPPLSVPAEVFLFTETLFNNTSASAVSVSLQIGNSGFGLTSPVYFALGTGTSNSFNQTLGANELRLIGQTWFYLPNGNDGVNLSIGGTVSMLAFASTASVVKVSIGYIVGYANFGGTV